MTFIQVHNHFPDFETDPVMMECLEKFEAILEREKMNGQLRMLNFACAEKVNTSSLMLDILKIQTQTVVVVGNKNADHTTTSAY